MGRKIAVEKCTNKICTCGDIECEDCLFYDDTTNCDKIALAWAVTEYVEPEMVWLGVAVDTPILVTDYNGGKWLKRHFAKYENGKIYAFLDGKTSWSSDGSLLPWDYAKLCEEKSDNG